MTKLSLILRSLRFHARSHLGALLGAAVGSTVLVGALAVGDSVRASLKRIALQRLGEVELALSSNDRFFRSALATELQSALGGQTVAVVQLAGTATAADTSARANRVQVLGVPDDFWALAKAGAQRRPELKAGEVILNDSLAQQLKAKPGDTVVLRVAKPSQISRDAPLAPEEDQAAALRLTVAAIAAPEALGRFSLFANQVASFNAFVPRDWLQQQVGVSNRANLLLIGKAGASASAANSALRQRWQLADAELELKALPDDRGHELRSPRVFLDSSIAGAALAASTNAAGVLTYLVNELRVGQRTTPYSMVTAMGAPVAPLDMRDDEILINEWLADDLQAKPGDELQLTYYVVTQMRRLEEQRARFRVRAILPLQGAAADPLLMPDFPGLKDAENCRDWDPGFAIDTDKMRPKDQKYWDDFRGTPKAFVTLAAGQRMWSNRFGNLTAVRYPAGVSRAWIEEHLRRQLDPATVGLFFEPVREQALAASAQSQDFGQLFLGFSFFLIIAALVLMALLFQFGIEQRAQEVGTLLALGYTPKQVRALFLSEGGLLALAGGALGAVGGVAYARLMLHGLSTIWRDAVGTSELFYHAAPTTLVAGALAGAFVSVATMWLTLRKQARQPAYQLLADGGASELPPAQTRFGRFGLAFWTGVASGAAAMGLLSMAVLGQSQSSGTFFGAGALLLIAGIAFGSAWLTQLNRGSQAERDPIPRLGQLGLRNAARRRRRSLATLTLLASGSFLIAAIGAFRLDSAADASNRSSGTGGFAFIGESTQPVVHDLNGATGRAFFGLDEAELKDVRIVPLRVRDGEDASCLNLNRAQKPRLLGVAPELLQQRKAFTFVRFAPGLPEAEPWMLLNRREPDGAVPAIGDQASIQWALGKKVGDTLDYTDERGQTFKIRLVASVANSILQGNLLIAEDVFTARFPTESGYRMFLIDAPSNRGDEVSSALTRALRDFGLELTPALKRLAAFNAVQNTYLNTFQVLGGLGLLLGSIGLGVVVLRNVLERRSELALMLAVGFRGRALKWLVLSEHAALLLAGLALGMVAALVAVLPSLLTPGRPLPLGSMSATLAAVLASGLIWTWLATRFALRGKLLNALRNE